jgi:ApaG protein
MTTSIQKPAIAVEVTSYYVPEQSSPTLHRFAFAYHITLTNHGDHPAQLLSRHWLITDGNGKETQVDGEGVIGLQPIIYPNQQFQYQSGALLETPIGTMSGYYDFVINQQPVIVPIPLFSLTVPNILN